MCRNYRVLIYLIPAYPCVHSPLSWTSSFVWYICYNWWLNIDTFWFTIYIIIPSLYCIVQWILTNANSNMSNVTGSYRIAPLWSTYSSFPSFPWISGNHWPFQSLLLPFPDGHWNHIYDWNHTVYRLLWRLLSLSNMQLRISHIFSWLSSSYLLITE